MIPESRVTYNYVISSLNYRCVKCQAKVQVPESKGTGVMVVVGLGFLAMGQTVYAAIGLLVIVAPFWRRLRNPVLSKEAMAALGLAELTPADIEPQRQPARSAQVETPTQRDWTSRAEQHFSNPSKEPAPTSTGRSRIQPVAAPRGFGRRAAR